MRVVGQRCRYQCVVKDVDGDPHFVVRVEEKGFEDVSFEARTPRGKFSFNFPYFGLFLWQLLAIILTFFLTLFYFCLYRCVVENPPACPKPTPGLTTRKFISEVYHW